MFETKGKKSSNNFFSQLSLKEGGILDMTSPIENETTNLVLFFKGTISYPKILIGLHQTQPRQKMSCAPPKEFLAKSLEKTGRITNKARHIAFSYLKTVKISPFGSQKPPTVSKTFSHLGG